MVNLPNIFLSKLFGALHIDIEVIKMFDTKIKMINSIIRILQEDFFGATRKAKRKARIFLGTSKGASRARNLAGQKKT